MRTLTHPNLITLDEQETIQDRLKLSGWAGYEAVGMACPGGRNDERVADIIRTHTGIKYARTVVPLPCRKTFTASPPPPITMILISW